MQEKFRNEVSREFHRYFISRIESGELTWEDIAEAFSKDKQWCWNLFYGIKIAKHSVTIEQLLTARDKFKAPVKNWF